MKNKPLLSVVPAMLLLCSAAAAESRLFLGAGANYIRPADENYRSAYGGQPSIPSSGGPSAWSPGFVFRAAMDGSPRMA